MSDAFGLQLEAGATNACSVALLPELPYGNVSLPQTPVAGPNMPGSCISAHRSRSIPASAEGLIKCTSLTHSSVASAHRLCGSSHQHASYHQYAPYRQHCARRSRLPKKKKNANQHRVSAGFCSAAGCASGTVITLFPTTLTRCCTKGHHS